METLALRPYTPDDRDPLARVLGLCFGQTTANSRRWIERSEAATGRILVDRDRLIGGLFQIPMGQFFGGRSVPMSGIAAVGVDPADRSAGAATFMMQETVRELRKAGFPLSTLFASTQPLYRRAGYEQAGHHFLCKVATARLFASDRTLPIRRMTDADEAEIARLHEAHGRINPGTLERNAMMWKRVREGTHDEHEIHAHVIEGEQGLEGYVYYRTDTAGEDPILRIEDVVVTTPGSTRRMLTFFREHRTLVEKVLWRGHPGHPLLLAAREQHHPVSQWDTWLLRIVDVEKALALRGYPEGVEAEVHLDVEDDVLPENAGRYVLRVAHGRGEVKEGGRGDLRLDVRTLAALYSGFVSPSQAAVGLGLDPKAASIRGLEAAFTGPLPWIQDAF